MVQSDARDAAFGARANAGELRVAHASKGRRRRGASTKSLRSVMYSSDPPRGACAEGGSSGAAASQPRRDTLRALHIVASRQVVAAGHQIVCAAFGGSLRRSVQQSGSMEPDHERARPLPRDRRSVRGVTLEPRIVSAARVCTGGAHGRTEGARTDQHGVYVLRHALPLKRAEHATRGGERSDVALAPRAEDE